MMIFHAITGRNGGSIQRYSEAITTQVIADQCNVELELNKIHLPKFDVPEGETNSYMRKLVMERLPRDMPAPLRRSRVG